MKTPLSLLAILTLFSISVSAQKEIDFSAGYRPMMKYKEDFRITSYARYSMSGMKELISMMEKESKMGKSEERDSAVLHTTTVTGQKDANGNYKTETTFVVDYADNNATAGLAKAIAHGHSAIDSDVTIDSVSVADVSDSLRDNILKQANAVLSEPDFPHTKMKIGQTVTKERVYSTLNSIRIRVSFKLKSISNGIAKFDVKVMLPNQTVKVQEMNMKVSGSGNGAIEYDIANHFCRSNYININISMGTKIDALRIDFNFSTIFDQRAVSITAL